MKLYQNDIPVRIKNIIKSKNFASLEQFYSTLNNILLEHTSQYLFNGDICFFYPYIHAQKAIKSTLCHISGVKIVENEYYYTYRPLLENLTQQKVYTITNTIKVSNGYEGILPYTLPEFENFVCHFNLGLDYNNICFSDFQTNAGDNALHLHEFSKQKCKRFK